MGGEEAADPVAQSHPESPHLAEGGEVSLITVDGTDYEAHAFESSGILTFKDTALSSITADVLVVGGGGGAGGKLNSGATDFPGGGGAGGLLYRSNADVELISGAVTVVVGTGGSGKGSGNQGDDGGDSYIGAEESPLAAKGGGGGGRGNSSGTNSSSFDGKGGGSGGGGGAGSGTAHGAGGTATQPAAQNGLSLGNPGGAGGYKVSTDAGGGGGGAGGAGEAASGTHHEIPGEGGAGWKPADEEEYDTAWITEALKVDEAYEFARGGRGGGPNAVPDNGANYGDGGSANGATTDSGGNGHDGIVIIRFPR
jgi:hypothetical protein